MNKLEQKIIDENYKKIDEFMGCTIYKKGDHRILIRPNKEPWEYEFKPECSQHNGCEKNLREIYKIRK